MENDNGSDPFDGEPGPRLRGATRSAKKGLLAHVLTALLKQKHLTADDLIAHSSPDGDHFIDRKFMDRSYRDTSGRVSETRRAGEDGEKRTKRSERTAGPQSSKENEDRGEGGDDPAEEGEFESPIG